MSWPRRQLIDLTPQLYRNRQHEVVDLTLSDDEMSTPPITIRSSLPSGGNIGMPIVAPPTVSTPAQFSQIQSGSEKSSETRRPASEQSKAKALAGKLKVKIEFEPKGFGEANFEDEVLEVRETVEDEDGSVKAISGTKRSASEAFDVDAEDGDDIQVLGGNVNVASNMPHPRETCTVHPFVSKPDSRQSEKNMLFCSNCYCYVCQIRAGECMAWGSHCNANCREGRWKHMRNNISTPFLNMLTPLQRAKYLAVAGEAPIRQMNTNDYGDYNDDDDDSGVFGFHSSYSNQMQNALLDHDMLGEALTMLIAFEKCMEERNVDSYMVATVILIKILSLAGQAYWKRIEACLIQWYVSRFRSPATLELIKAELSKSPKSFALVPVLKKVQQVINDPAIYFTVDMPPISLTELPVSVAVDFIIAVLPILPVNAWLRQVVQEPRLSVPLKRHLFYRLLELEGAQYITYALHLFPFVKTVLHQTGDLMVEKLKFNLGTVFGVLLAGLQQQQLVNAGIVLNNILLMFFEDITSEVKVLEFVANIDVPTVSETLNNFFASCRSNNQSIAETILLPSRLHLLLLWFVIWGCLETNRDEAMIPVRSTCERSEIASLVMALVANVGFRVYEFRKSSRYYMENFRLFTFITSLGALVISRVSCLEAGILHELQRIPAIKPPPGSNLMNFYLENKEVCKDELEYLQCCDDPQAIRNRMGQIFNLDSAVYGLAGSRVSISNLEQFRKINLSWDPQRPINVSANNVASIYVEKFHKLMVGKFTALFGDRLASSLAASVMNALMAPNSSTPSNSNVPNPFIAQEAFSVIVATIFSDLSRSKMELEEDAITATEFLPTTIANKLTVANLRTIFLDPALTFDPSPLMVLKWEQNPVHTNQILRCLWKSVVLMYMNYDSMVGEFYSNEARLFAEWSFTDLRNHLEKRLTEGHEHVNEELVLVVSLLEIFSYIGLTEMKSQLLPSTIVSSELPKLEERSWSLIAKYYNDSTAELFCRLTGFPILKRLETSVCTDMSKLFISHVRNCFHTRFVKYCQGRFPAMLCNRWKLVSALQLQLSSEKTSARADWEELVNKNDVSANVFEFWNTIYSQDELYSMWVHVANQFVISYGREYMNPSRVLPNLPCDPSDTNLIWKIVSHIPLPVLRDLVLCKDPQYVFTCQIRRRRTQSVETEYLCASFEQYALNNIHQLAVELSDPENIVKPLVTRSVLNKFVIHLVILSVCWIETVKQHFALAFHQYSLCSAGNLAEKAEAQCFKDLRCFVDEIFSMCPEEDFAVYAQELLPTWLIAAKDEQLMAKLTAVGTVQKIVNRAHRLPEMTPYMACLIFLLSSNESSFFVAWKSCKHIPELKCIVASIVADKECSAKCSDLLRLTMEIAITGWPSLVNLWQTLEFTGKYKNVEQLLRAVCSSVKLEASKEGEEVTHSAILYQQLALFIARCLLQLTQLSPSLRALLSEALGTQNIIQGAYMERVLSMERQYDHMIQPNLITVDANTATIDTNNNLSGIDNSDIASATVATRAFATSQSSVPSSLASASSSVASTPPTSYQPMPNPLKRNTDSMLPDAAKLLIYIALNPPRDTKQVAFIELVSWPVLFQNNGGEKICRLLLNKDNPTLTMSLMLSLSAMSLFPNYFAGLCFKNTNAAVKDQNSQSSQDDFEENAAVDMENVRSTVDVCINFLRSEHLHPQFPEGVVDGAPNRTAPIIVKHLVQKDSALMAVIRALCWLNLRIGTTFPDVQNHTQRFFDARQIISQAISKLGTLIAPLNSSIINLLVHLPNTLLPVPENLWKQLRQAITIYDGLSTLWGYSGEVILSTKQENICSVVMVRMLSYFLLHEHPISMAGALRCTETVVKFGQHCVNCAALCFPSLTKLLLDLWFAKMTKTVANAGPHIECFATKGLWDLGNNVVNSCLSWSDSNMFGGDTNATAQTSRSILEYPLLVFLLGFDPNTNKQPFQKPLGILIKLKIAPKIDVFAHDLAIGMFARYLIYMRPQLTSVGKFHPYVNLLNLLFKLLENNRHVRCVGAGFEQFLDKWRSNPAELFQSVYNATLTPALGTTAKLVQQFVLYCIEQRHEGSLTGLDEFDCLVYLESQPSVNKLRLQLMQSLSAKRICLRSIGLTAAERRAKLSFSKFWPTDPNSRLLSSQQTVNYEFYWNVIWGDCKMDIVGRINAHNVFWIDLIQSRPAYHIPATKIDNFYFPVPHSQGEICNSQSSSSKGIVLDESAEDVCEDQRSLDASSNATTAPTADASFPSTNGTTVIEMVDPSVLILERILEVFRSLGAYIRENTMNANMRDRMNTICAQWKAVVQAFCSPLDVPAAVKKKVQEEKIAFLKLIKSKKAVHDIFLTL